MNVEVKTVIHDCAKASSEERSSFGEVVARLSAAGVERYHVDFIRSETNYYLPDGDTETVPIHPVRTKSASAFSAVDIVAAVRGAQTGTLKYRTFCERAAEAGCVGYMAFMAGRRVVYYGRTGDSHVEWFPDAM